MKVGFIGLGSMGAPMARNIISAGHDVAVYNRTRSRAQVLGEAGARVVVKDTRLVLEAGDEVSVPMPGSAPDDRTGRPPYAASRPYYTAIHRRARVARRKAVERGGRRRLACPARGRLVGRDRCHATLTAGR